LLAVVHDQSVERATDSTLNGRVELRLEAAVETAERVPGTFRHSFGTLLKANGEDIKTVQELLRHANSRITLDVYTQAVTSNKRAAQSKVVRMMVPNAGTLSADVGTMDSGKIAVNSR